jgi:hypothetical protein
MNCKDIEKLLVLYHDGELDQAQREEIESHLAECPRCRARLAELAALDELIVDGEAERVPDPGKHYWYSFSKRVTRKLTNRKESIIPRRHTHPLKFRIIPYLSAAVAVFLALVISIPLLKQAPTKFTEEEITKLTTPPQKSEVGFKKFDKEPPLPEAELKEKKLAFGEYASESAEKDVIEAEGGLTTPREKQATADVAGEGVEVARPAATGREHATKDERATPSRTKAQAPSEEEAENKTAAGASAKESEEYWSFDRQFTTEADQTGILRVEIDSTGQLAKVTIYHSSGDSKADTLALRAYRQQWEGKVFRERQRALYVPFGQDADANN